jgi:uncharacterized protein YutE (UPF0331/DUF86 family)
LERTWKDNLGDGVEFLRLKRWKEAVYNLHTAATMMIEDHYRRGRGSLYLVQGVGRLTDENKITQGTARQLEELNELRNRIYHRAYTPTPKQAEAALEAVRKLASELEA